MIDKKFTIILLLFTYFCLGGLAAWLTIFEVPRLHMFALMQRAYCRIASGLNMIRARPTQARKIFNQSSIRVFVAAYSWLKEQHYAVITTVTLTITPMLIAISLGSLRTLDGFEESKIETSKVVSWLLRGEQLVSPPPLPPEVFITKEVQLVRPTLGLANRDWALLEPDFRQRLLEVFKIMSNQHGYQVVLLEGYRSPQRQNMLANAGSHLTNATAFQSYHQFGLAADVAFLRNGRLVITESDPWVMRGYQLLGEVAETQEFVWGGRWKLRDFGHLELRKKRNVVQ